MLTKIETKKYETIKKLLESKGNKQLGIYIVTTSVPKTKGRIERMFNTLQSRLSVELQLADISTIEQANEFLNSFIQKSIQNLLCLLIISSLYSNLNQVMKKLILLWLLSHLEKLIMVTVLNTTSNIIFLLIETVILYIIRRRHLL